MTHTRNRPALAHPTEFAKQGEDTHHTRHCMTTTTNDDPVLSFDDTKRLMTEIIANAGEHGATEDDLLKACDKFADMVIGASVVTMWERGQISALWNVDEQDIGFKLKDQAA